MATSTPQSVHRRISWTVVIELDSSTRCLQDVIELQALRAGSQVVVNVDHVDPSAVDYRVPELLLEAARSRDLHLELRGSLSAVRMWWRELAPRPPAEPTRRLRLVRP